MRLHDLEDEEVVFADQPVVVQAAFEARVAFGDQRRADALGLLRREPEMFELVDLGARGVADPDDDVRELGRRQVDHAFPALADHLEAVVGARNDASDEGRREFHDRVPAHGHDVPPSVVRRRHQHDGTGLQITADLRRREVGLPGLRRHFPESLAISVI